MKRVLASLLGAGFLALALPAVSQADQCTFCANELEEGINPLNCPSCLEIADEITRGNELVWVLELTLQLELVYAGLGPCVGAGAAVTVAGAAARAVPASGACR